LRHLQEKYTKAGDDKRAKVNAKSTRAAKGTAA
jgi:hypothetical protein